MVLPTTTADALTEGMSRQLLKIEAATPSLLSFSVEYEFD
jgi:hypothetical protein